VFDKREFYGNIGLKGESKQDFEALNAGKHTYLQDFGTYLKQCVKTLDPNDEVRQNKEFSQEECYQIIAPVVEREPFLLLPKSRQMMMSWICMAYCSYLMLKINNAACFVSCKKEGDAGFDNPYSMLSRIQHIFENLPQEIRVGIKPNKKPPKITLQNGSFVQALTKDDSSFRQYAATLFIFDEFAFQKNADLIYTAIIPACKRLIGLSTPNGKFNLFYRLVFDTNERAS